MFKCALAQAMALFIQIMRFQGGSWAKLNHPSGTVTCITAFTRKPKKNWVTSRTFRREQMWISPYDKQLTTSNLIKVNKKVLKPLEPQEQIKLAQPVKL